MDPWSMVLLKTRKKGSRVLLLDFRLDQDRFVGHCIFFINFLTTAFHFEHIFSAKSIKNLVGSRENLGKTPWRNIERDEYQEQFQGESLETP